MKTSYHEAKQAAKYISKKPTLTDQSAAAETDRNVIVHRFLKTGQAPGSFRDPMYADMTELPEDLRGYMDLARTLNTARSRLPEQLRNKSMEELMALTPETLKTILKPPATKPANNEGNDDNAHPRNQGHDAGLLPGTDGRPSEKRRSREPGQRNQQSGDSE